ncbi:MAG: hypothetical protein ACJATI_003491, partial [Halioglobus sp.]
MHQVITFYVLAISFLFPVDALTQNKTLAHDWNEVLIESIKNDFARPTIHARNLWHSSAMMYDIWALSDDTAQPYFIGNIVDGYDFLFSEFQWDDDPREQLNEAISYAMYRLLIHRFANSPEGFNAILRLNNKMDELGFSISYTNTNYANGEPGALGNYIADLLIQYGLQDGSNELLSYNNQFYTPVNDPMVMAFTGNPNMQNPNRWQQLTLDVYIDQSGNEIPYNTPDFLSPEWGEVTPFAIPDDKKTIAERDGQIYTFYHDPGPPPYLDSLDVSASENYKKGFGMVVEWSSQLDPSDGVMIDISPASLGNAGELPDEDQYYNYYNYFEGGDPSMGHELNPITGQPYESQLVPRGDYARVLAEFWADGPDSETPPGHWFTLINYVNSHPMLEKRYEGVGPIIDDLEWDIKSYFMLGAAMHDSAISTWGIKGYYDYLRPVSAIRYMADKGQCTDPNSPNYDPEGMDLIDGSVELVESGDPLAGNQGQHIGKIKVRAWKGPDYINIPESEVAGVDWILAEDWWPYQRPSFVTPPFAGYVSGHSTFSRAAAEILTMLTGDEFFPGGMGTFEVKKNEFLVFEDGPSQDLTLQWATYRDASDQTSLSRIWGGIHPPADDIPGRKIGIDVANDVYAKAESLFFRDTDEDGYWAYEDCNDVDATVYPGAPELCDNIDNDCDGQIDNAVASIMCASNVSINSEPGVCGAAVTYVVITSGNCTNEEIMQTAGQASGTVFPIGTTTNTFTIADPSGNTIFCSMDVTVIDNELPTALCQPLTVQLDNTGAGSITPEQVDNGTNDACGIASLELDKTIFDCSEIGLNDVTLTVTDVNGNISICMAEVTVEDNINPTITCPSDIEMDNDMGVCGAVVIFDVIADDNCAFMITQTAGIASGSEYPVGETMNTYVVTDASGAIADCSFMVTVNDVEGPVIDCPSDIYVQLEVGECEELVFFDIPFMDNCGTMEELTIEQTGGLSSGSYFPKGTTSNSYIVTDLYGNITECTFDVVIVEFSNGVTGVMTCNDNINVSLDQDCELVLLAD